MCGFYEIKPMIYCSEEDGWDDKKEDDWNGCCEDPYDDDEEENEREWCD